MKKFRTSLDEQLFLLPPSVKEFVPAGHPAQFIYRVVREELNLKDIEVEYVEERGAPPFLPATMTGLLLYGYMRGVYSSRQLARACEERLDFKLITGMNQPDHRTIAKFRCRHNEALKELFVQVVKLCMEAKIVNLKHVAIDGTRMKASAAKDQSIRYKDLKKRENELQEQIDEWFEKAEHQDQEEDEEHGEDERGDGALSAQEMLKRYREAKQRLEKRVKEQDEERQKAKEQGAPRKHSKRKEKPDEEDQENLVDPDSRMLKTRDGYIQGYNCQAAVDRKNHIIVSAHVSQNGDDHGELAVALEQIKKNFKCCPQELSADTGYFCEGNLKLIHESNIRGYVAAGRDPDDLKRKPPTGNFSQRMIERLRRAGKRSRYRFRKETVEPVFGNIKAVRGFRQFLLRGKQLVEMEFSLLCSVHNLWKLFNCRALTA